MGNEMLLILKNKGFSLVEILIASALGIGVILYLSQYIKINEKANDKVMSEMEKTSDNLNMEAILRKDLTGAKHSLNNLNYKDDNGNKFFDYLSNSSCLSNCARSVKLVLNGNSADSANSGDKEKSINRKPNTNNSIYFIITDTAAGEQQIYNPADAYTRNTMNFNSLNYLDTLGIRESSPWNFSIKSRSVLMMIYSPIEVFSPFSNEQLPGRNIGFMGWAGLSNYMGRLIPEPILVGGLSYYNNTDPRNGKSISSEDEFFKVMPFTIGLGSFAFLTAVKVIRYHLDPVLVNGKISGQLIRGEMNPDKTFTERPVGFNINMVEFYRETISSPAIYIKTESAR